MDSRTLFQTGNTWLTSDAADPLNGWSLKQVQAFSSGPASADTYGKLFYFVRTFLGAFLSRLSKLPVSFRLFRLDASDLHKHLRGDTFDRIEATRYRDRPCADANSSHTGL